MTLPAAVASVLKKYATFSGRARRSELWWWVLAYAVVYGAVASFTLIPAALEYTQALSVAADAEDVAAALTAYLSGITLPALFALAFLLPNIAVQVRRLHDIGKSGAWWWFNLVPFVGAILLIVWFATEGTRGPNQFGPDPKAVDAPAVPVVVAEVLSP